MSSNRTKYSEEMREQTAIFILESGKSATSVAEEKLEKEKVLKDMIENLNLMYR